MPDPSITYLIDEVKRLSAQVSKLTTEVKTLGNKDLEGYISPPKAARLAGVAESTIDAWLYSGKLEYHQPDPGGRRMIKKIDLVQFIEGKSRKHQKS